MSSSENVPRDAGDCSPEEIQALRDDAVIEGFAATLREAWGIPPADTGVAPHRIVGAFAVETEEELMTALLNGPTVLDGKDEITLADIARGKEPDGQS